MLQFLSVSIIFLLGLFIGSFLGVVIERVPKRRSIVSPPSHCEKCKKPLKWYDNIPLLSFALLKGKCRFCKDKLSIFYPFIELITAVVFVFTALNFHFSILIFQSNYNYEIFKLLFYLFISSCLIAIFFIDLKHEIIPSGIVYPAVILNILFLITINQSLLINHLFSALGAFFFFLLIFLITRGHGMGFGDVQYAFLMGLFLGFPAIIVGLYGAFLTGGIVSFILILWRKKRLRGSTLPFGPFLVFGTFFALFFSKIIVNFFLPGIF